MLEQRLAVESVSLTYGSARTQVRALDGVSLSFQRGHLTLVSGPSGSGKTTLLAVLGCLVVPDTGEVRVMGQRVNELPEEERARIRRQSIGYIFQAFRLFHSLSALDNVLLSRRISGNGGCRRETGLQALEAVGLGGKAWLKPHELSGGEKQRVAIARVLVNQPPIILADEPTASLDTASGAAIARLLLDLAQQQRVVVVVSHDLRWHAFCHRMVTFRDGSVTDDCEVTI